MDLFDKIVDIVEEENLEKLNQEIERTKEELKKLSLIKKIKEDKKAYYLYRIEKHKETIKNFLANSVIAEIFDEYKTINIKITANQIKVSFKLKPELKQIIKGGKYEKSNQRISGVQSPANKEQEQGDAPGVEKND
jgi:hypothetical protein